MATTDYLLIGLVVVLLVYLIWMTNKPLKKKRKTTKGKLLRALEREQRIQLFKNIALIVGIVFYGILYLIYTINGWDTAIFQGILAIVMIWVIFRLLTDKKII